MITFLSSPKAFTGQVGINQIKAIRSWKLVHPKAEVVIYGDSTGASEACRKLGAIHIPDIQCSPSGVPLFNAIVDHARDNGTHDLQLYLNCDILMPSSLLQSVKPVNLKQFLIVGQRIDLSAEVDFDIQQDAWIEELRCLAIQGKACLHMPSGMDYFIFPRGLWNDLRSLVIGRGDYDCALIAYCYRNRIPIIDATYSVPALHQYHDYGHVEGAHKEVLSGRDAEHNRRIHGVVHSTPNTSDAQFQIRNSVIISSYARGDWLRRIELYLRFVRGYSRTGLILRAVWRFLVWAKLYRLECVELAAVIDSNLQSTRIHKSCA